MESNSDSYFEESSENEQEVAAPLNIQVNVKLESLESPHPQPESPSSVPPPSIPEQELSPGWEPPDNGNNFMNYCTRTDVIELKTWAQETRNRVNDLGYVVEAPIISQKVAAYLQEHHGPQWEAKFLQLADEPLFERMLAYIVGNARLTSFNKHRLRSFYETWAFGERTEKLCMLAESGGFLKIE